jgi:hypothetical protein
MYSILLETCIPESLTMTSNAPMWFSCSSKCHDLYPRTGAIERGWIVSKPWRPVW